MSAVVVIPVYKEKLTDSEVFSYKRVLKVLGNHPVILVCPESLDTSEYQSLHNEFRTETFADDYFNSIKDYNRLLINPEFYQRFSQFDFMLLYQLDALVFRDDLEYWCKQDFDYIGAPWFWGFADATENSAMLPWSGNGGLSLRKTSSMLAYLELLNKSPNFKNLAYAFWFAELRFKPRALMKVLWYFWGSRKKCYLDLDLWEDQIFSILGASELKIAPPEVGLQFSFETQPQRLFIENGKKLPFGCHAWEKYEPEFWNEKIKGDSTNELCGI